MNTTRMERELEQELKASLVDGYPPCAVAFRVAEKLKVARRAVGVTANRLGIRVVDCQLGCFTFEKAVHNDQDGKDIDETVAQRIKTSLVNGRLPCVLAFKVGGELEINPKDVGDAANRLNIKISSCQLGCFR